MRYIYTITFCLFSICAISQNLEWAKSIGSSDHDWYRDIFSTKNNDIISFGDYTASIDLDPGSGTAMHSNSGGSDAFVQKLDANGNYIWSKVFGNGGYGCLIIDMAEDKYGNLYFTGSFRGTLDFDPGVGVFSMVAPISYADIFILKLDSNGDFIWVKSMGGTSPFDDQGSSIYVDENLNIYTAGSFDATVDFDPNLGVSYLTSNGSYDAFIQKLDSSGNLIWVYSFGSWDNDVAKLFEDGKGNLYITGTFNGNVDFDFSLGIDMLNGNGDVYILKIDTNASFKWVKYFNGPTIEEFVTDMKIAENGNIYLVGGFGHNNMTGGGVVDFDPSNSVVNKTNSGEEDIFEVSLDSNGNLRWVNAIGGAYNDRGMGVTLDNLGNVFFVGTYEASVDFDTGLGVDVLPGYAVFSGMYVTRLFLHAVDTNGLHQWALYFGGDVGNTANIISDNFNKLLINGDYKGSGGDFDPNSGVFTLPFYGGFDCYTLKFNSFPVGIDNIKEEIFFTIYPNPTTGQFIIEANNLNTITEVEIYDVLGKLILKKEIKNIQTSFDISSQPKGIYLVKLVSGKEVVTLKIVHQ